MSGRSYTPVFSSIYTGTLYGRWPAAAVWATLLPLFDRHGVLDVSIDALCGMTGWPRDLMELGIKQLMEADPSSRSLAEGGRRLVLLDEARSWGWKAVNHGHYREQARLLAKDSARTASGLDAERKRKTRENKKPADGDVPRRPPESPGVPLSDGNGNENERKEVPSEPVGQARPARDDLALVPTTRLDHDPVEKVFDHWKQIHGHTRTVLTASRRKLIAARLREYSEADLCQSISGYKNSPHHQGANERDTVYDAIELMLRDAKHVDAGMRFYEQPPRMHLSAKTRQVIDQTEGWIPPELRRARHEP